MLTHTSCNRQIKTYFFFILLMYSCHIVRNTNSIKNNLQADLEYDIFITWKAFTWQKSHYSCCAHGHNRTCKIKLSLSMPQRHKKEEVHLHSFLTQYYIGMTGQLHFPATLPPEKNSDIQWIRSWVGPTAGLNIVETRKITCSIGIRTPDHPVYKLITILAMLHKRARG
jgi:hypothetical protein